MFYGGAVVWVRELFTRPNRDVFVDMIGSVVSLHSTSECRSEMTKSDAAINFAITAFRT